MSEKPPISEHQPIHGLMAEFDSPDDLVRAARASREAGYQHVDAYSPVHVDGLASALGMDKTRLPWLVLAGGTIGAISGYSLQVYGNAVDYPFSVGGRPLHSWPAFVPVTFELTILCAALAAVLGMLTLNGLPKPYHPVFNVPRFALASRDRFFLCVESSDPKFDRDSVHQLFESAGASGVFAVEE